MTRKLVNQPPSTKRTEFLPVGVGDSGYESMAIEIVVLKVQACANHNTLGPRIVSASELPV